LHDKVFKFRVRHVLRSGWKDFAARAHGDAPAKSLCKSSLTLIVRNLARRKRLL
jgi:hypothetical protein